MIPRVPEAGHEQSVGRRLVLPAYLAGDDHYEVQAAGAHIRRFSRLLARDQSGGRDDE
jgi:hypothetical protein